MTSKLFTTSRTFLREVEWSDSSYLTHPSSRQFFYSKLFWLCSFIVKHFQAGSDAVDMRSCEFSLLNSLTYGSKNLHFYSIAMTSYFCLIFFYDSIKYLGQYVTIIVNFRPFSLILTILRLIEYVIKLICIHKTYSQCYLIQTALIWLRLTESNGRKWKFIKNHFWVSKFIDTIVVGRMGIFIIIIDYYRHNSKKNMKRKKRAYA